MIFSVKGKLTEYLLKATLSVLFVFVITSCTYNKSSVKNQNQKKGISSTKALILVWDNEDNKDLWAEYKSTVFSYLKDLYDSGQIAYALPFEHKSLKHPDKKDTWANCVIVGLYPDDKCLDVCRGIVTHVQHQPALSTAFVAADVMNLQKGLDMFYSVTNGIEEEGDLEQIVEYVFSDPQARKKYYGEQYVFSGPAMSELHNNNMAGRFIGYEVESRLFGDDFPRWDLIHVVGFTKEQSERATPIFLTTWNKHAERAFGEGMTFQKKIKEWDKIRLNIKSDATQKMNMTLPFRIKSTKQK